MGLFNSLEISHEINYIVECNCRKEYCLVLSLSDCFYLFISYFHLSMLFV